MAVVLMMILVVIINQIKLGSTSFFDDNPLIQATRRTASIRKLDQCFCELTGPVDTCVSCCHIENVDSLNNNINPVISSIVFRSYFRFFKINLNRACPFWSDDGRCVLKDCFVEHCSEDEVPQFLKGDMKRKEQDEMYCDDETEEEKVLSQINDDISDQQVEKFTQWILHDESHDTFCYLEDEESNESSYVDLVLNPERYTGYSGRSPRRIWSAIYNENCFSSSSSNRFDFTSLQKMCLEKRVFYQLISGIHSSINIHLSAQYILSGGLTDNPKFGPNLNEFVRRFDSSTTNNQGPNWLRNLYFTYLLVLRAVTKGERIWNNYSFYTGNIKEDELVKERIVELLNVSKGCGYQLFDEKQMFSGNTSAQLKEEFRSHFYNISRIMDCVGCNKCRLWGTLQITGLGTALKILFNPLSRLHLSRQEIVSLFNVLGKLSNSIKYLNSFRNMTL